MKLKRSYFAILLLAVVAIGCTKDNDPVPEPVTSTPSTVMGSLWINIGNEFIELDLQEGQEINVFDALEPLDCKEFEGTFICTQGEHTGTKTLSRKDTFNGDALWSKQYPKNTESYYGIKTIEIHQRMVFVGYSTINSTSYTSTYSLDAIDMDTGNLKWTIELANEVNSIAFLNGQLIVELAIGSSTTDLLSINAENGHIANSIPFTDRIGKLVGGSSSIFVMTWNNTVVSMNDHLSVNWTFITNGPNLLGGIEIGDNFVLYSRDRMAYSLQASTGTLQWKNAYSDHYPLSLNIVGEKVCMINQAESETDIQIRTLNLSSGNEIDSCIYTTDEGMNTSSTQYHVLDEYLLIFSSSEDIDKTTIALVGISDKTVYWKKEINQRAFLHLISTS